MDKQTEPNDGGSGRALTTRHNEPNTGLGFINLLDEKQLASAELFLKKFMSSEKGGIKSIADGLSILARAQDLQLPFTTCIEHIHVINGKTGVDVHIIKSLLSRAGVVWKCTKDYTPQYQYTDGNTIYLETQLPDYCVKCRTANEAVDTTKDDIIGVYPVQWFTDLKGNVYNEFQISEKCVKAINKAHALKLAAEGKFPIIRIPAQPIDYVTEYEFTRYKIINGVERIITAISHYSYSEAQSAELFTKDTYKKYARIMIGHRAFILGARDIANDVLMGCMETTELKIVENVPIRDVEFVEVSD
ncbi:MAG: recombinase [crAssphage sp. isolate ctcc615]|uniref:Recombinase n=1 Tax=crAssphage sp. isolate ctcc615 TaxID=2989853 RepID=A0A345BP33_9CAUD|nr:MAG: recombinase [crAssphage sp. isolate ctcc615]AXF52204.1 MAG: recombinase [crAssphage sp. isolate ctcc615]